ETKNVSATLPMTGQRFVAIGSVAVGLVAIGAGAVFAGLAVHEQNQAEVIYNQHGSGPITTDQHVAYDTARGHRDENRRLAGVACGAGGAFAIVGLLLYAFDQPQVNAPPPRSEQPTKAPSRAPSEMPMEMSAVPLWSPGAMGAAVSGRF